MFFSYTMDNFVNIYIFYSETERKKWCVFVATKLAEEEQNHLWPMYGNQDDAKHTVAAAVKNRLEETSDMQEWHNYLKELTTVYSRLSGGNAEEGVGRIIEIQR